MIEQLAHYRVLEPIGTAAVGEMYRARDLQAGRTVAITVLTAAFASNPDLRERLLADARAAAALSHPNIASLYEVGEDGGHAFLVFEFVPGRTLAAVLSGRPMNARRALDLAAQIADALAEGHAHGIVHGNLTAASVIVTPRGNAKIVDFGVGGWMREGRQSVHADEHSDIVSLGLVLSEMLTGTPGSAVAARTNKSVPGEVDAIVAKALAKERGSRYEAAAAMAAELRSVAAELDARTERAGGPIVVPHQRSHRSSRRAVTTTIALAAIAAAAAAAWLLLR